jgi:hypothetical protein
MSYEAQMQKPKEQEVFIGNALRFNERIQSIKTQFFSALDDFKKYYVFHNKNPEVDEYQNYYMTNKNQLQTMSNEILSISNEINDQINALDIKMADASNKLKEEKQLYEQLLLLMNRLQTTQNGSEILIDDSKIKYNTQYLKNAELFIGIMLVSVSLIVLFKKKQ